MSPEENLAAKKSLAMHFYSQAFRHANTPVNAKESSLTTRRKSRILQQITFSDPGIDARTLRIFKPKEQPLAFA